MKASNTSNSISLPQFPTRHDGAVRRGGSLFRRLGLALAACSLTGTLLGSLTGCITTRKVNQVMRAPNVMDSTLAQLNSSLAEQYGSVKSLYAAVDIKVSTGGQYSGEVKEIPTFSGYILLRKPTDLRVFMQLPVVRSLALDMVSDGSDFKLLIPPKSKAYTGSDHEVETKSKNGLENLRPYIIRDALLVPPLAAGEIEAETQGARILPPARGKKQSTEEPDYDLIVVRPRAGTEAEAVRVIHISRVTLKPYEQDVYDHAGRLVTVVTYEGYKPFGDIVFPTVITITRPLDEYTLQITVNKLTLNQPMDDEQFVLKIPESIPVTKM